MYQKYSHFFCYLLMPPQPPQRNTPHLLVLLLPNINCYSVGGGQNVTINYYERMRTRVDKNTTTTKATMMMMIKEDEDDNEDDGNSTKGTKTTTTTTS